MKVTRLRTCETAFEANLIKGRLKNEGIESFVTNENFSTLMPGFNRMLGSGVQIMVFEKDYNAASAILTQNETEQTLCPDCKSENISSGFGKNSLKVFFAIILSIFSAQPFNNINTIHTCQDCGKEFK